MNIIICDDDPVYLKKLEAQVNLWRKESKKEEAKIKLYQSSEDLLEQLDKGLQADVYLLDILFDSEMNGLDLALKIRKYDEKVMIVFITSSEAYAKKGYEVQAFRYLSKPISYIDLAKCLDVAYRQYTLAHNEYLILINAGNRIVLRFDQITYIEARSPYVEIHSFCDEDNPMSIRGTLSMLINKLPSELFVQCHRSYIINILNVQSIRRNELLLSNGSIIPISRSCFHRLCNTFDNYYQGGY